MSTASTTEGFITAIVRINPETGLPMIIRIPDHYEDWDSLGVEFQDEQEVYGCECEQDWNCGIHGGTNRPTWIETRYQGMDADEARYYGAYWDL